MQKKCYILLSLMLSVLIMTGMYAHAQDAPLAGTIKAFAQTSLDSYVTKVVRQETAQKYGFQTLDEAKSSRLGEPLRLMTLDLKDVKAYRPGAGIKSMPVRQKIMWYPVLVNSHTRAKLEVVEHDGKLLSGPFGAGNEAKRVSAALERIPGLLKAHNAGEQRATALVKIPALKATFLYVETASGNYLVPAMYSAQRFNLKPTELYPAEEVLLKLKKISKDLPDDLLG